MTETTQPLTGGIRSAYGRALRFDLLTKIENRSAKVAVIGQGYVGLPVAMRSAEVGFTSVVGYEIDKSRCDSLRSAMSYVEDVPSAVIADALTTGYLPTDQLADLAGFDIAVITVPTPLKDGVPYLGYITAAAEDLAQMLSPGALVVLESTTHPGTTNGLVRPILESSGLTAGNDFLLGYSPERIDPGNKTFTFVNTPKVVAGIDRPSTDAVEAFYRSLVDRVVVVERTETAELVKILENTYRHVNIALVNELAMFARDLGVDIWSAIDAAATKPFGFTPFRPGPGVGGHCLPVDPSFLSWRVRQDLGQTFRFIELANDVNDHMPDYVVQRVTSLLNEHRRAVNGTKVLLLGMTYKAGTSDMRESPSVSVAKRLMLMGAEIRLCDPHLPPVSAPPVDAEVVDFGPEALAAADLVVILVDHDEFDPATIATNSALVFDTKAVLRGLDFAGELL
ncbi:MAG: nucleotide sugar dehydrogenase [Acidimicrobiales bacterium]